MILILLNIEDSYGTKLIQINETNFMNLIYSVHKICFRFDVDSRNNKKNFTPDTNYFLKEFKTNSFFNRMKKIILYYKLIVINKTINQIFIVRDFNIHKHIFKKYIFFIYVFYDKTVYFKYLKKKLLTKVIVLTFNR